MCELASPVHSLLCCQALDESQKISKKMLNVSGNPYHYHSKCLVLLFLFGLISFLSYLDSGIQRSCHYQKKGKPEG